MTRTIKSVRVIFVYKLVLKCFDHVAESVDLSWVCGPAGADTGGDPAVVHVFPGCKGKLFTQFVVHCLWENDELLVCCGIGHKAQAAFLDSYFDLQSQFNAMTADLIIKSVCKRVSNCRPSRRPLASTAPPCFMIVRKSSFRAGLMITAASPKSAPHLVPPMQKTSQLFVISASVRSLSGAVRP